MFSPNSLLLFLVSSHHIIVCVLCGKFTVFPIIQHDFHKWSQHKVAFDILAQLLKMPCGQEIRIFMGHVHNGGHCHIIPDRMTFPPDFGVWVLWYVSCYMCAGFDGHVALAKAPLHAAI